MTEWETCCSVSVPVCCLCPMSHDRVGNLWYCLCACLFPVSHVQCPNGKTAVLSLCLSVVCVPVPGQEGKHALLYCACLLSVSQYQGRKGNLLYCTVPVCCLCLSTRTGWETCCIVLCLSAACTLVPGQEASLQYCTVPVSQYQDRKGNLTNCTASVPVCCLWSSYRTEREI
jgi:hypothetical protein